MTGAVTMVSKVGVGVQRGGFRAILTVIVRAIVGAVAVCGRKIVNDCDSKRAH